MFSKSVVFALAAVVFVTVTILAVRQPLNVAPPNPRQPDAGDSVVRYASDDFFAACYVRPRALTRHPYLGSLPIERFLPDPLTPGRLEAMGVEELVVFCAPATESARDGKVLADLEWAGVARTAQAIDLETIIRQWRQSLVHLEPGQEAKPTPITMDGCACFRVPAGTLFAPARSYGKLRFIARDGQPAERGTDVGYVYPYRSYLEGATKACAIFTLDQIDETDLADGRLLLELRPNVFLVHSLGREYATAQIELRNPDNGLRSEPVTFDVKSYVNHSLSVPRSLTAVVAEGKKQFDLLKDFVSHGRLEVFLSAKDSGMYLGVGEHDLNVRPKGFEYVFVSQHEIAMAQSLNTLKKMLAATAAPVSMAKRLTESKADLVMLVSAPDRTSHTALGALVRSIGIDTTPALHELIANLKATLSIKEGTIAKVTAEIADDHRADKVMRQIQEIVRSTKDHAHATIGDSLKRLDTYANLVTLGYNGVLMRFPDRMEIADARESEMLSIIDASLDNISVEAEGKVLTLQWSPPPRLSQMSEAGKFAIANMEEVRAQDLFARERFDLGDEMYQRVTDRFPHVPQAWFRRAHQLAYNTSIEFDGYATRYAWVRRGVNVLLDGLEQNADSTDLAWLVARFVGWKIGDSDDRVAYRKLFSRDEQMHQRLARIVDLGPARSADQQVDNWLVAKLLFEHCVARQENNPVASAIPPLWFFSHPAAAQAGYAQSLTEVARWTEAAPAWKQTERLYGELGIRTIQVGNSQIRLADLESRMAQSGPDDETFKLIQNARKHIQHDYWLARCKLEPTVNLQLARKLAQQAAEHERQSNARKTYDLYLQSLRALSEVHKEHPTQLMHFVTDFQPLAASFRKVAEELAETGDVPAMVTLIEESQAKSRFPYLESQIDSSGPIFKLH